MYLQQKYQQLGPEYDIVSTSFTRHNLKFITVLGKTNMIESLKLVSNPKSGRKALKFRSHDITFGLNINFLIFTMKMTKMSFNGHAQALMKTNFAK